MLDALVDLIETLRKRIDRHGQALRENEIRTRVALVDPLLCALGWDTSNPDLVEAEYSVGRGRADYALLGGAETLVATVEAKKLGEPLDPHLGQMLTYANESGIAHAAITDGNHWQLYEVFGKPAKIEDRAILRVRVADGPPVQCAMQLLPLWQRNLLAGNPAVSPASRPKEPEPAAPISQPPSTHIQAGGTRLGTPLTALDMKQRDNAQPRRLLFPDGREADVGKGWVAVLVEVVEWLVNGNRVRQRPLLNARNRILLNTRPKNNKGNDLISQKEVGGLYFEGNVSPKTAVDRSIQILTACGVSASEVRLDVRVERR